MPAVQCPVCFQENSDSQTQCQYCQTTLLLHNRYLLQKRLGKGGSSQVFLALDQTDQSTKAIKILQNASDWKGVEHFERQLSILQSLSHSGIPKVFEHFTETAHGKICLYSVQEWIEGESLSDRIKRGHRYQEDAAKKLLEQLLEILSYLHSLSPPVLHRDIKPQNIMMRPNETPVLIDFDTARGVAIDKERADGTMVGTAGFVPMEQLSGQASAASDIYSLGMTMVAVLSHKEIIELPVERMKIKFEGFINVSAGFQKVLRKMTEPAQEDRYQTIAQVQRALQQPEQPQKTKREPEQNQPTKRAPEPPIQAIQGQRQANADITSALKQQDKLSRNAKKQAKQAYVNSQSGGGTFGKILWITAIAGAFGAVYYSCFSSQLPSASGKNSATVEPYSPDLKQLEVEGTHWANKVSGYSSQWGETGWSAERILNSPDVFPSYGTNENAWTTKKENDGIEWISVDFGAAIETKAIVIVETSYPGGVIRIDDISETNNPQIIWEGNSNDPNAFTNRALRMRLHAPKKISAIRIILDTRLRPSWEELDAVGLIPVQPPTAAELAAIEQKYAHLEYPAPNNTTPKAEVKIKKLANGDELLAALLARNLVWATGATASSEYKNDSWSAQQATGVPNAFPYCGDSSKAWAPKEQNLGTEILTVNFPETVATGVAIVENDLPGSLIQIENLSNADKAVTLWSGATSQPEQECRVLEVPFAAQKVMTLRFTFDTKNRQGWEEIDAVGLIPAK